MLDFTSSLYLGLKHGSASIEPWDQLTTGTPAALTEPPGAGPVAQTLAALMGCGRGLLLASTLHLFWDAFGALGGWPARIYWDAGLYPIARWGLERAAGRGAATRRFAHHDAADLRRLLERDGPRSARPVVISDGFCPGCGREAPLKEYLETARAQGGVLVLDDTQALGIFGRPSAGAPYGMGGGGSLRRQALEGRDVLIGASLAKAFGVPVAVLAGDTDMIRALEAQSETRVHCSPPSAAVIHASRSALAINARYGDALRHRLAQRVARFHRAVERIGLAVGGGLFPTQSITGPGLDLRAMHRDLRAAGIRTVLHRARCNAGVALTFVITAGHSPDELDRAAQALAEAAASAGVFGGRRLATANGA